jgi:AraC family transcriptional regulator
MILRELPDARLVPLPENAAFRQAFYARWGRENAVVMGSCRRAEFEPWVQTLSVKRAWGGTEEYLLEGRRLAVDDGRTLVLNEGARYGARIASRAPVTSLAVFFRPGMAAEVAAAASRPVHAALDRGAAPDRTPLAFAEHLRPADDAVGALMTRLRDALRAGEDDDAWLEERLHDLLAAMLEAESGWRARAERLRDLSRSSRDELLARVDRAADCLLSRYAEPLTLDDLAAAATLSKYHLLRAFRLVHGTTPMAMLARQRAARAARLLADAAMSLDDVAACSGFGSRQTLFRQLRRHYGDGGRALRARQRGDVWFWPGDGGVIVT